MWLLSSLYEGKHSSGETEERVNTTPQPCLWCPDSQLVCDCNDELENPNSV